MIDEIRPRAHQRIYFSYYNYDHPYFILQPSYRFALQEDVEVLLICAIARTDYLLDYLHEKVNSVKVLEYADHHYFSKYDVANLKTTFDAMEGKKKIIITTEKDAMRLEMHRAFIVENQLPIYALPVRVHFHFNEGKLFDEDVKEFLLNFRA